MSVGDVEPEPVYPRHWGPSVGSEDGDIWLCAFGCPACGPCDGEWAEWDWPDGLSRSDLTCGGTADA